MASTVSKAHLVLQESQGLTAEVLEDFSQPVAHLLGSCPALVCFPSTPALLPWERLVTGTNPQ